MPNGIMRFFVVVVVHCDEHSKQSDLLVIYAFLSLYVRLCRVEVEAVRQTERWGGGVCDKSQLIVFMPLFSLYFQICSIEKASIVMIMALVIWALNMFRTF